MMNFQLWGEEWPHSELILCILSIYFFLHLRHLKKNLLKTILPVNELWITFASVKAHLSTWQCESLKANKGKKRPWTLALAELSFFFTRETHPRDSFSILHKLSKILHNVFFWRILYKLCLMGFWMLLLCNSMSTIHIFAHLCESNVLSFKMQRSEEK